MLKRIDEDFSGGGYVFTPNGQCLHATPDWQARAVYLAIDFETKQVVEL